MTTMLTRDDGFTLIDVLTVTLLLGVVAGISLPGATRSFKRYELASGTRAVAAQVRMARQRAVTASRTMRVRFNCPSTGQYRVVEFVDDPAIDDDQNRCSAGAYPYPDQNAAALPGLDGPVMVLPGGTSFAANQDFDIDRNGRVTVLAGVPPVSIEVTDSHDTQTLTVSVAGRVTGP
jgi:type II secretory pathway pseudopilin PulG